MAIFHRTTWMIFGICAPCLLLAAFAPGTSRSEQLKKLGRRLSHLISSNDCGNNNCVNGKANHPIGNSKKVANVKPLFSSRCISDLSESDCDQHCPPEWEILPTENKAKLAEILSWENLAKKDFNMFEVSNLTRDPLLLVGWAIFCEPMAQEVMRQTLDVDDDGDADTVEAKAYHYNFNEHMMINPRAICNFLREIESRYKRENPYHNNIHAADVTQNLHYLIQLIGEQYLWKIYDRKTIFCLLLAATFHDVGHPGTNNQFQQNAMTQVAIQYNDLSVLENMHSAVGQTLLLGDEKRDEWDIFEGWTYDEKAHARKVMTGSILATDMSKHFEIVAELKSLIDEVQVLAEAVSKEVKPDTSIGGQGRQTNLSILSQTLDVTDASQSKLDQKRKELADFFLIRYLLHAADISNSIKGEETFKYWADCVLTEFFAQGDKEKDLGLPISDLCDRDTVVKADSQIGFVNYIVLPMFELLAQMIPRAKEEIVPSLERTLEYWKEKKLTSSTTR
eukprot:CAMPEP_0183728262 /NCGR_PEP_ID=MMETSP0737-20130205/27592_1 /TAXON_ID=385413 /ORGANISM="Thalassiosira miniscula, Strain CCMP1093" /LENGTH=506 /DNA_ID=CAMNT_0025960155 /DNA_START=207 /DNA_END=1727 /DNA_ORIENTATION=-